MINTVFIIGSVWVEPKSSAAGSRMLQLMSFFQKNDYQVVFGTTAQKNPNSLNLEEMNVATHILELNHRSFDELLKSISPQIVLFDRFITEEQFGWRVAEHCPEAIRILDTEDLHCLRKTREKKYKSKQEFQLSDLLTKDISKREIASILRCDLSLIISKFEMKVLKNIFKIDEKLLLYLPFLLDVNVKNELPSFQEREHFVSVGNFLHSPNLESVIRLKKSIWPRIKQQLPQAQLHIYGAYPTQQILEFHDPHQDFYVHGFVYDLVSLLQKARVLLAPLSYGAGLKGKFLDAMINGCPSVTTSIGIEGYSDDDTWCGLVAEDDEEFANKAVLLYSKSDLWMESTKKSKTILSNFESHNFEPQLQMKIENLIKNLIIHRKENFLGSLLQQETLSSKKYLSKWIEEKNRRI